MNADDAAGRLEIVTSLLGGTETCPHCGTETKLPPLITPEDAMKLLDVDGSFIQEQKNKKQAVEANKQFCEITGFELEAPKHHIDVRSLMSIPEVRELVESILAIKFTDPTSWERIEHALTPFSGDS